MGIDTSISRWTLLSVLGVAMSLANAYAHHSISGAYDTRRQVRIDATVADFQFVNPHPFLVVNLRDRSDGGGEWRLEMDNRRELSGVGMGRESFEPGDRVVVTGNPSLTEIQKLYIRRLERPKDGFVYEQVGTRPRISRSR